MIPSTPILRLENTGRIGILALMSESDRAFRHWLGFPNGMHRGQTVWKGDVEVFALTGHPKAKRCYGWSYGEPNQFITILERPPVDSARAAVKVGMAYQVKKGKI